MTSLASRRHNGACHRVNKTENEYRRDDGRMDEERSRYKCKCEREVQRRTEKEDEDLTYTERETEIKEGIRGCK
ncbi:hypothetical protein J6590_066598 [Homalodisca vitripennis]|nr:hypothetical protein J6590_066598 [Homalodisca vitripennis]